jgi:hypothetical protein
VALFSDKYLKKGYLLPATRSIARFWRKDLDSDCLFKRLTRGQVHNERRLAPLIGGRPPRSKANLLCTMTDIPIVAQISQSMREFPHGRTKISSMIDGVTERLRPLAGRTELVRNLHPRIAWPAAPDNSGRSCRCAPNCAR